MKVVIRFDLAESMVGFLEFLGQSLDSDLRIAQKMAREWPGMTPLRRTESAFCIERKIGRAPLERAARMTAIDGGIQWLRSVQAVRDIDLVGYLIEPRQLDAMTLPQRCRAIGLEYSQKSLTIRLTSEAKWADLRHTEFMTALETSLMCWRWHELEGAMMFDTDDSQPFYTAGRYRRLWLESLAAQRHSAA